MSRGQVGVVRYDKQYLLKVDDSTSQEIVFLRTRKIKLPPLIRRYILQLANEVREKEANRTELE